MELWYMFLCLAVWHTSIFPIIFVSGDDYMEHRVKLLEDSIRNFVYETQPEVDAVTKELVEVKKENRDMKLKVEEQENVINDLKWATYDIQTRTLSKEERDLVTEMKWTIFDLKAANEELQEEACVLNTKCEEWTDWSACSVSCGAGTKIRSRQCEKTGRFSSMCDAKTIEETECTGDQCTPMRIFPQLDCQDGYESYQGYCFRFSGRQDTRLLSKILCEEEGAYLVSIQSKQKQNIVWDYLKIVAPAHMVDMNEDFSKREFWDFKDIETKTNVAIDGIRKHQQDYFIDYRGQTMTHFNWAKGQPRNSKSDGDYCVTMNVLTGEWYMNCVSVTFFYVCESDKRSDEFSLGK